MADFVLLVFVLGIVPIIDFVCACVKTLAFVAIYPIIAISNYLKRREYERSDRAI